MEGSFPQYIVEKSKSGNDTIAVISGGKKLYLHSRFDPLKEAENFKERFNPDKFDCLILLGTGLGYHLQYLREKSEKYKKIIAIDVFPGTEKMISAVPGMSFLAGLANVVFANGMKHEDLFMLLDDELDLSDFKGIDLVEHPASINIFHDYYIEIKKRITWIINKKTSDLITLNAFGKTYLKNIFKNFQHINNMRPVSGLKDAFSGFPAMVITSGPSIEKHLEMIRSHQSDFFIIAVDSVMKVLNHAGIMADFYLSVDPQAYVAEHLQSVESTTFPVYSISSANIVFSGKEGFLSLNTHPVSQFMQQIRNIEIGSIDSLTGNVAGDAVMFADYCGFSPVAIAGFDFSFPDKKIYSRGTAYQKRYSLFFSTRLLSVETQNMNYIRKSSNSVVEKGLNTRRSFLHYRAQLENLLDKKIKAKIYNLRKGGLEINNIEEISFEEFIISLKNKFSKREIVLKIKDIRRVSIDLSGFIKALLARPVFDQIIDASIGKTDRIKKEKYERFLRRMI